MLIHLIQKYCFCLEISEHNFMLTGMVKELTGGYKIKYHANCSDSDPIEIDFTPPFRYMDSIAFLLPLCLIDYVI